ncbi:MAG: leucine-rich repeat domain-containing protein [Clostridia bacterium]|nr:leucine-rich repeat domain-containing protein [Clostridia bacterium]MBQ7044418.1 leucine-rich repeat domain-containing protein [Clostridia bacterium]
MPLIPLDCPSCGANLTVDSNKDAAICEYCGKPYVVKDAIVHNYINNVTNITADTVNVYSQKDFEIRGGVLEKYNGESVDVIIPDNVKDIGGEAFKGLSIESVKMPSSVTSIGSSAFAYCRYLKNIEFSSGLKKIYGEAFIGCVSLKTLRIPNGVTTIQYQAFADCSDLEFVTIPVSLQSIGQGTFNNCIKLKDITIPEGVVCIEQSAFFNCRSLTSVTFPRSLKRIEESAFMGCDNLTKIARSGGTIEIGSNAFYPCSKQITLVTSEGSFEVYQHELGRPIEEIKKEYFMKENKCTSCGGDFTGLIMKKCSKCGKSKDY